jgi:hypothetical protein
MLFLHQRKNFKEVTDYNYEFTNVEFKKANVKNIARILENIGL